MISNPLLIAVDPRPASFLTAADVPPNLLRLKPGDRVAWRDRPRSVIRVGYRLTSADFKEEAQRLLDQPAAREARNALERALGVRSLNVEHIAARALAGKAGLGGPERGIWVKEWSWEDGEVMEVRSVRCVRLGTYYSGGGGWFHGPDRVGPPRQGRDRGHHHGHPLRRESRAARALPQPPVPGVTP